MAQRRTSKKKEPEPELPPPEPEAPKMVKRASARLAVADLLPPSSAKPLDEAPPIDGESLLAELDKGLDEDNSAALRSLWGTVAVFGGTMSKAAYDALSDEESFGDAAKATLVKAGVMTAKKNGPITLTPGALTFALRAMKAGRHGFSREVADAAIEYALEIADEGTLTGAEEDAVKQFEEELPLIIGVALYAATDNQLSSDSIVELVATLYPHCSKYPALLPMWQALPTRLVIRPVAAGRSLHAWGQLELGAGKIAEARALLKRAIELQMRSNDQVSASIVNRALGEIEEKLGNFRRARSLYGRAIRGSGPDVRNTDGESSDGAGNSQLLGRLQMRLGRFGKARRAFERALDLATRERDEIALAAASAGLGDALLNQGETELARVELDKALEAFKALNDSLGVSHVLASLAVLDLAEGEKAKAKTHLSAAKKSSKDPSAVAHIALIESNIAAGA